MSIAIGITAGAAIGAFISAVRYQREAIRLRVKLADAEHAATVAEDECDTLLDQSDNDATIIRALEQQIAEREAVVFMCEELLGFSVAAAGEGS